MKKIFAIVLAAAMLVSVFAVNAFAAAGDTNMLVEIGDVFGTLVQSEIVDVVNGGEFTLTATLSSAASTSSNTTFIAVKTAAGNVKQETALPDGTTVTVTSLELDGVKVELDDTKTTSTAKGGVINGNDCVVLLFQMGELNALVGDIPANFKAVTITFTVNNPEAAPAPAADDNAPAADDNAPAADDNAPAADDNAPATENTAPVQDTTPGANTKPASKPANTGIVLCVLPMAVAAAAVVVSKRK